MTNYDASERFRMSIRYENGTFYDGNSAFNSQIVPTARFPLHHSNPKSPGTAGTSWDAWRDGRTPKIQMPTGLGTAVRVQTGPDPQGRPSLSPGETDLLLPHGPHASARLTARIAPHKTVDFIGSARMHG